MSLADELLADLEEGGDEEVDAAETEAIGAVPDIEDVSAMDTDDTKVDVNSVHSVAKLLDGEEVLYISCLAMTLWHF